MRADVPFGHPHFGMMFECECLSDEKKRRQFEDLQRFSNLDQFRDKSFKGFDGRIRGADKALAEAKKFARDPRGWLVLVGGVGRGKTHLAAAIANEVLAGGSPCLFTVVPELLDHLRSTFAPGSDIRYDELFEQVKIVPLLVLDDLGTENATPWAEEKLYQIINYRYNNCLPTVITTNRSLGSIDPRIASRMQDHSLAVVVIIEGDDYRVQGEKQSSQRDYIPTAAPKTPRATARKPNSFRPPIK